MEFIPSVQIKNWVKNIHSAIGHLASEIIKSYEYVRRKKIPRSDRKPSGITNDFTCR